MLVVYKFNDSTLVSRAIADAYVAARSIPTINLVGLNLPNDYPIGSNHAYLAQNCEEIRVNDSLGWVYYRDKIATQLETYLSTNVNSEGDTLKNVIRYIVFCKGIPHKVRSLPYFWAWSVRKNVSTDALACLLFQNILTLYGTWYGDPFYYSPLNGVDQNLTLDYRFLPNHFVNAQGWKLSYLVTRLDGDDYQDVNAMIQRSLQPDVSGEKWRILDDDPCTNIESYMQSTYNKLVSLGFNNNNPTPFVNNLGWITSNTNGQVIGYTSFGNNAARDTACSHNSPRMPSDYVLNTLNFQYANGAIFHTWESFNGWTFSH